MVQYVHPARMLIVGGETYRRYMDATSLSSSGFRGGAKLWVGVLHAMANLGY